MYWNYRVVRREHKHADGSTSFSFEIHEAYYDTNDKVSMITQDPVGSFGETLEELIECHKQMGEAFGKPILDYDKIPEEGAESEFIDEDQVSETQTPESDSQDTSEAPG